MKSRFVSLLLLGILIPFHAVTAQNTGTEIPTQFQDNRIFVTPVTITGDTLQFYTDTGGGRNIIWPEAAQQLELKTKKLQMHGDTITLANLPSFLPEASLPLPSTPPLGNQFLVASPPDHVFFGRTGFLGSSWFSGRIWEFDYSGKRLTAIPEVEWAKHAPQHTVRLGFQTDSTGQHTTYFPRIPIQVDGESIDMLFDTGATVPLGQNAAKELGKDIRAQIGGSFIIDSLFTLWHRRHPKWKVIQHAEKYSEMPMIRVPEIKIAGYTVGPVWFTQRADVNFIKGMSRWMDKTIYGAVGGSALQYFRIIIDYPNEKAVFYRE